MKNLRFTSALTAFLVVFSLLPGCGNQTANNNEKNSDAGSSKKAEVEEPDGYLPVFDKDHGQNTISNRMQKNFARFEGKADASELEYFKSAGLKIYKPSKLASSEKFTGFLEKETGVSLIVMSNPFSMEKTTSQIVSDAVRTGKTGIIYTREIEIDGRSGVFYLTKEPVGESFITKCLVAFGDEESSWIVTATFNPELEAEYGEELLKSILNVHVAEEGRSPPGSDLEYTLEPNRLVVTPGFVDKLVFTLNGKFPSEPDTKEPIFQVGRGLINFDVAERRKLAIQLISPAPPFQIDLVSSEQEVQIDGLDGFEFVSLGTDLSNGEPLVIYSVILFAGKHGYVMHGWASTENEQSYVTDFRGLAQSFKLKESMKESK